MLINTFNDILPRKYYQYHVTNYLNNQDSKSALKLKNHKEAIDWLLSDEKDLCFKVLNLSHLSKESILSAISNKFNGNKRFIKFFSDPASENGYKMRKEEINVFNEMKKEHFG